MKPRNLHSERQILPFDIGRTDFVVIRDTEHFSYLTTRHARRRIATSSRILGSIEFGDRGIGGAIAKVARNGRTVRSSGIGTYLC
jgi:hypothetical protein